MAHDQAQAANVHLGDARDAGPKIHLREFCEHGHLNCPNCKQLYDNPQLLPCLDSVCEKCTRAHPAEIEQPEQGPEIPHENFICPRECCKKKFSTNNLAEELVDNRFLANMVEAVKLQDAFRGGTEQILCTVCTRKERNAVAVCLDTKCRQILCQPCQEQHVVDESTLHHRLVEVGRLRHPNNEGGMPQPHDPEVVQDVTRKEWYCHRHPEQLIRMYCAEHEEVTCLVCGNDNHRECRNFKSVEALFSDDNPKLQMCQMIQRVQAMNDELQGAKNHVNTVKTELQREQERVKRSIDNQYAAIVDQLTEQRDRLKEQTTAMYRIKADLLDHQHDVLEHAHQNVSHSLMFIKDSVDIATQVEFYFLKCPIERRLEELQSILNDTHQDPLENNILNHTVDEEAANIPVCAALGSVHSTPTVSMFTVQNGNGVPRPLELVFKRESEIVVNCNDAGGSIVKRLNQLQSIPRLQVKLIPVDENDRDPDINPEEAQNAVTGNVRVDAAGGTYLIQVKPQELGAHRLYVYLKRPAPYEIELINDRQPVEVTVVGNISMMHPMNNKV